MFVEGYTTVEAHEKYIDRLAKAAARCKERLRTRQCRREACDACEKAKSIQSCTEMFDEYSKVIYADLVDDYAAAYAAANPTLEEMREHKRLMREAEIEGKRQAMKDMNHDWFFYGGGWIGVVALVVVPIIIPIIGCMEWYL